LLRTQMKTGLMNLVK